MESCKKRALIIGGIFLVVALVALIVGIALTNSSSSGSGSPSPIRIVSRCKLPKDVGPCKALDPSWYFEAQTGDCKEFGYGGCGGNENRFSSEEECRDACL